jgi:hypothetical protein
VAVVDPDAVVRCCGGGDDAAVVNPGGWLVVCSSAAAAVEVAAVVAVAGVGAWEARPLLALLAEGWGGAVGFLLPKVRQSTLNTTGVQRLVGRALG